MNKMTERTSNLKDIFRCDLIGFSNLVNLVNPVNPVKSQNRERTGVVRTTSDD